MNSPPSDPAARRSGGRWSAWFWAAVAMTLCKVWLTDGQTLFAIGNATHDDRLALNLASALVRGEWLGPYNILTLAKGPFYSLWIAFVFLLDLPLMQAQQLLYAGAGALVVRALAPAVRPAGGRFALFALLLWNPMSFDAGSLGRVLRQDIYPPLTLMLFAAMIALHLRLGAPWRRLAPWAATLGLVWAAFWLTREESIWIVPSLALLGAATVVAAIRHSRAVLVNLGRAAAVAGVCALVPIGTVCALNARHYGWFGTVEFRATAFKDAYGALVRVIPEKEIPFVPVTRATRERIYAVSPTFAVLKPYLEGPVGRLWATNSAALTHRRPDDLEIGGGWFMWALRQAAKDAGRAPDAHTALAFYAQMAREINQACDDGRLPAGPRRSGFLPRRQPGQLSRLASTFADFAEYFISFRGFSAATPKSEGSGTDLDFFRDLTRTRLSPPSGSAPEYVLPHQDRVNTWKVGVLQEIGRLMRRLFLGLAVAAQLVGLARAGQLVWQRRFPYPFVLAVAAWGGCVACLLVFALVQVTSFPTLSPAYLAPAYPLLLLFVAAVVLDAVGAWTRPAPVAGS